MTDVEKSIEEIKIQDLIEHIRFGTQLKYDIKDYIYSIEILLTDYEEEKELLELASNMLDNIDYDQIPIEIGELKSEFEKEKEKNKELESYCNDVRKEMNEENRRCMLLAVENQDLKEKNKRLRQCHLQYEEMTGIEIILNLIEKQSKEIEELKEDKYGLEEEVQMQAKNIMLCENALCEIQDKIKAKIEEIDYKMIAHQDVREAVKQVLQSLLEKE